MNLKDIVAQNEKETRAGFGDGIHELAKENDKVVTNVWQRKNRALCPS